MIMNEVLKDKLMDLLHDFCEIYNLEELSFDYDRCKSYDCGEMPVLDVELELRNFNEWESNAS